MHVLAFHSWAFWRGYVQQEQTKTFKRLLFINEESQLYLAFVFRSICRAVIIFFWGFTRVALISWAVPAAGHVGNDSDFAMAYAVVMIMMYPMLLAMIFAAFGLLLCNVALHVMDAVRVKTEMTNVQVTFGCDSPSGLGEACSQIASQTQARLSYGCSRWQFFWIHGFLFALICVIVAAYNVGLHTDEVNDDQMRFMINVFFFSLGVIIIILFLGVAAVVTYYFSTMVRGPLFTSLRKRNVPTSVCAQTILQMRNDAVGFVVLNERLTVMSAVFGLSCTLILGVLLAARNGGMSEVSS
jgi:hypothetical protein